MQSAGQRTLTTLASKLHPPLTLSPHESRQLLQLLTQSFRSHLDREHPIGPPTSDAKSPRHALPKKEYHNASSHNLASNHLDSILTNPLLAHKPRQPGSEPAVANMIKDPLGWFLDQVAIGTANLSKAATCVTVLRVNMERSDVGSANPKQNKAATLIAEWLRTSQYDTSREFLDLLVHRRDGVSLTPIIPLLLAEGNQAPLWRWLTWPTRQGVDELGWDTSQIKAFQQRLLFCMINSAWNINPEMALVVFLRAHSMVQKKNAAAVLQRPGAMMVNRIIEDPGLVSSDRCSSEIYDTFLLSTSDWLSDWSRAVKAMLWLHRPTHPTAQPGLTFIKDPMGARIYVKSKNKSRNHFLVRLCLGVARQLIAEDQLVDARTAMEFAQEHFAHIVLTKAAEKSPATLVSTEETEQHTLDMLDRILLT